MKVHHLNCATLCPPAGRFLTGNSSGRLPGTLVCHCLLIETESGLVLVDTGLGLEDIREPVRRLGRRNRWVLGAALDPEETAVHHVSRLGFTREDVQHIVMTHLDVDHAGGMSDFPDATVHLYRPEARLIQEPLRGRDRKRYRAVQWKHRPKVEAYDLSGERFYGFEAVRQLRGLPPEVLLVPLAGHSEGHCGVAVERSDGWLFHAGDAYMHRNALQEPPGPAPLYEKIIDRFNGWDQSQTEANRRRLRTLANDPEARVRIVCSHDPEEFLACCQNGGT